MLQIHERIKAERIKANLSEDELADKIGIGRTTYQYWEKKTPAVDKIKQVARALGLSEDYFFVNHDENNVSEAPSQVHEDPAIYNMALPLGDLVVTLKDYVDLLKEKARHAEEREKRLLALLEKDVRAIKTNSETIQSDLEVLTGIVRSDDEVILKGTDRILGREEGASSTEAYIGERAFLDSDKEVHTTDSKGKRGNEGKARQQGKA